jgi:hypothetical protein
MGPTDRLIGYSTAVLIDQGSGGGVMSHAGQAGARLSGQRVAQVMEMEVGLRSAREPPASALQD